MEDSKRPGCGTSIRSPSATWIQCVSEKHFIIEGFQDKYKQDTKRNKIHLQQHVQPVLGLRLCLWRSNGLLDGDGRDGVCTSGSFFFWCRALSLDLEKKVKRKTGKKKQKE